MSEKVKREENGPPEGESVRTQTQTAKKSEKKQFMIGQKEAKTNRKKNSVQIVMKRRTGKNYSGRAKRKATRFRQILKETKSAPDLMVD